MKGALAVMNMIKARHERDVTFPVGINSIRGDVCMLASCESRTFFFKSYVTFLVVAAAAWSYLLNPVAGQRACHGNEHYKGKE